MIDQLTSLQGAETGAQSDIAAAARDAAKTATAFGPRSPQEQLLASAARRTLFAEALLTAAKARFNEYRIVTR